jgi:hypothetical protein
MVVLGVGHGARADENIVERAPARLYFHEAAGVGVFVGRVFYDKNGTQDLLSAAVSLVSTLGARIGEHWVIGGQFNLNLLAAPDVTEDRALGHIEYTGTIGVGGNIGPSFTALGQRFHVDLSPGIYWLVVPHDSSQGRGNTFGGVGPGLVTAAGYDIPVAPSLALGFEARLTLAATFSPTDATYEGGINFGAVALVSLRRR